MAKTANETGETLAKHRYDERDRRLILAHVGVSVTALLIGAVAGLLQVVERAGWIRLPGGINYYQMLTLHGVLLALVFTRSEERRVGKDGRSWCSAWWLNSRCG